MKRHILTFLSLIALLAAPGCLEGPDADLAPKEPRTFSVRARAERLREGSARGAVAPPTKAAPTDALPSSFIAWGYTWAASGGSQRAPDWICGDTFSREGSLWRDTAEPERPADTRAARLFAIAPAGAAGVSSTPAAGVNAPPSFRYAVPADPADQTDLLVAYSDPAAPVPEIWELTFSHALAGLQVRTSSTAFPECTVASLTLVGAAMEATWTPSGWTDHGDTWPSPADIGVTVPGGSSGLDLALLSGENTMMLIPQVLGPDAGLIVSFDEGGMNKRQTVSLAGVTLAAGYVTVLRLAADGRFEEDWIEITGTTADEEGEDFSFSDASAFRWRATERDQWRIADKESVTEGSAASLTCDGFAITVAASGGGYAVTCTDQSSYADLSYRDYTGAATAARNTANTYVITRAGSYKIPLVYGNAVKAGATNAAAYTPAATALNYQQTTAFLNHAGNQITAPLIEDNAGCTATRGGLVWQTHAGLVTGTHLRGEPGSSCRYVVFDIDAMPSGGGVAVVAAYDENGDALWSWALWVTAEDLSPRTVRSGSNHEYGMMPADLCQTTHATEALCAPVYQWGRKDPFWESGKRSLYTETGSFLPMTSSYGSFNTPAKAVANPQMRFSPFDGSNSWWCFPQSGHDWWDAGRTAAATPRAHGSAVKSVYDPCPAGWMVPPADAFTGFTEDGAPYGAPAFAATPTVTASGTWLARYRGTEADATGITFLASGYRLTTDMTASVASSIVTTRCASLAINKLEMNFAEDASTGGIRPVLEGTDATRTNEIRITGTTVDSRSEGFDNSGRSTFRWRPDAGSSYVAMRYLGKYGGTVALADPSWEDGLCVAVTDPAGSCTVTCTPSLLAEPLTFEALGAGTVAFSNARQISVNGGAWTNTGSVAVAAGDVVRVRYTSGNAGKPTLTGGPFRVYGNLTSATTTQTQTTSTTKEYFKDQPVTDVADLVLPARYVRSGSYEGMLRGTAITVGPVILAEYVAGCKNMFTGCSSLRYIRMTATAFAPDAASALSGWTTGVAATGTFVKAPEADLSAGHSGIPFGWNVDDGGGRTLSTAFIFTPWGGTTVGIDLH